MSLEFHFNSTVTSEPSHIGKEHPVFLRPHTQVICFSVQRLRVLLRRCNVSVMLIVILGVWCDSLHTHRINGHCYLRWDAGKSLSRPGRKKATV